MYLRALWGSAATLGIAIAALFCQPTLASAATVGNAPIDRGTYDTFANFGIVLTDVVVPTSGIITSWSTYIGAIDGNASTDTMALMLLNDVGGGTYEVNAIDERSISSTGLNEFQGTSISAMMGDILGIYMGTAKVSFNFSTGSGDDEYTSNNYFSSAPNVGDTFSIIGSTDRVYSLQAEVSEVPLPAGGLLLLTAMGGFAVARRKLTAA